MAATVPDIEHQVATAFTHDVTNHRMSGKLDHGLHRYLVFEQREHSWNNRFELVTWPGKLAINGRCVVRLPDEIAADAADRRPFFNHTEAEEADGSQFVH